MIIRRADENDIPQMHDLRMCVRENRLANPGSIQPVHYRAMLGSGAGWVCERGDRIVGFAIADRVRCSVWALFVDPAYEGQGIGRQLHDAMLEWFDTVGVTRISLTTDPNTRAERFYRAAGWRYAGKESNGEARYEITPELWKSSTAASE